MNAGKRIKTVLTVVIVVMAVMAQSAHADLLGGQLGILTAETLAGDNPATGAPWAEGDTYRLAFYTSGKMTSQSADIAVYNAFVQGFADATSVYDIGATEGVTWKAIGSTDAVDARDNTSTNITVNGTGEAIFLLDGSTVVANDYADLWDGSIQNVINQTETGDAPTYFWPCTGTYTDGTEAPGHGGSHGALGDAGEIQQGAAETTANWVWRTNTSGVSSKERPLYALSDPLHIVNLDPTVPNVDAGSDWVTWSGAPVTLNDVEVVSNVPAPLTFTWSASPSDGVVFTPNDGGDGSTCSVQSPTVTITKATENPSVVTLTIAVNNEGSGKDDVERSITIDVYDSSCIAAQAVAAVEFDPGDFNKDCIVNLKDFVELAAEWLEDYKLTEPATISE